MLSLFSRAGLRALDALPPAKTLLAFDFDGTLAPLVSDPDAAFTFKFLLPSLRKLEATKRLAIISGRGVADVSKRLLFNPDYVIGNHGLEGVKEFRGPAARARATCRIWVKQINKNLGMVPPGHGIYVEDKKESLSLHFRHARDRSQAQAWLEQEIKILRPRPRVIGGKLIFNVVPKGSPHKGTALKALMKRLNCTHAVFVGDDVTDEDAFKERGRILSVRVGRKKDSHAQYYVPDQKQMLPLLKALAERML